MISKEAEQILEDHHRALDAKIARLEAENRRLLEVERVAAELFHRPKAEHLWKQLEQALRS